MALLHGLTTFVGNTNARWLLHTAIVERPCGHFSVLLINSDDAYLMSAGTRYFRRLLGYRIARLRLPRSAGAPTSWWGPLPSRASPPENSVELPTVSRRMH